MLFVLRFKARPTRKIVGEDLVMGVCVMLIWLSIALKFHFDNADGSPIAQVHCAALHLHLH